MKFYYETFDTQQQMERLESNIVLFSNMIAGLAQLNIWSKVQYNHKVELLEAKLNRLWTNLKGKHEKYERFTTAWVDIGFQGKDPATDFRGAGLLGLE